MTVSSSEVNTFRSGILIPKSITGGDADSRNPITISDVPGHYNFKAKLQEKYLAEANSVIIVIDSKDKDKLAEAADILYDVINDIDLATAGVPILIACNKQDLTFAKRGTQLERDLQIEIEQIKKVRRAAREQE